MGPQARGREEAAAGDRTRELGPCVPRNAIACAETVAGVPTLLPPP